MGMFTNMSQRMARQAHLMGGMMERLDVDVEAAGQQALGLELEKAARSCFLCRHSFACEEWQAGMSSGRVSGPPAYCPNRAFFAAYGRR